MISITFFYCLIINSSINNLWVTRKILIIGSSSFVDTLTRWCNRKSANTIAFTSSNPLPDPLGNVRNACLIIYRYVDRGPSSRDRINVALCKHCIIQPASSLSRLAPVEMAKNSPLSEVNHHRACTVYLRASPFVATCHLFCNQILLIMVPVIDCFLLFSTFWIFVAYEICIQSYIKQTHIVDPNTDKHISERNPIFFWWILIDYFTIFLIKYILKL